MIYSSKFSRRARFGFICALVLGALTASADMKMVSKVTIETPRGPKVVTVVTFIKGHLMRIDTGDIRKISDSRTHKIVMMNTLKRNYFIPDTAVIHRASAQDIKSQNMKIKAQVQPTGKRKTIAGRSATQYVGELLVTGDYSTIPGAKAEARFKIDQWTTEAKGVQVSQSEMMGTVGDLLRSVSGVAGMQDVTRELSKIKGVPLNSTLSGTLTLSSSSGGAPRKQNISFTTEAMTVNESTLPASIFKIPAGYVQVGPKPPASKPNPTTKPKKS
jgi:hypothetical protein